MPKTGRIDFVGSLTFCFVTIFNPHHSVFIVFCFILRFNVIFIRIVRYKVTKVGSFFSTLFTSTINSNRDKMGGCCKATGTSVTAWSGNCFKGWGLKKERRVDQEYSPIWLSVTSPALRPAWRTHPPQSLLPSLLCLVQGAANSLTAGRCSSVPLNRTVTERTVPSLPGWAGTRHPSSHCPRGVFSSITKTISSTCGLNL